MPHVAEMDRVDPVQLRYEGDVVAALAALRLVAIGSDAGDQDVLDLVLAGPVQDETLLEAAGHDRAAVAAWLALGARQGRVVRVAVGRDVGGDAAARWPDDR